jgi:hypothetical protein
MASSRTPVRNRVRSARRNRVAREIASPVVPRRRWVETQPTSPVRSGAGPGAAGFVWGGPDGSAGRTVRHITSENMVLGSFGDGSSAWPTASRSSQTPHVTVGFVRRTGRDWVRSARRNWVRSAHGPATPSFPRPRVGMPSGTLRVLRARPAGGTARGVEDGIPREDRGDEGRSRRGGGQARGLRNWVRSAHLDWLRSAHGPSIGFVRRGGIGFVWRRRLGSFGEPGRSPRRSWAPAGPHETAAPHPETIGPAARVIPRIRAPGPGAPGLVGGVVTRPRRRSVTPLSRRD